MQLNRHISTAFKSMGTILSFNGAHITHSELAKRGQQILFWFFPNTQGVRDSYSSKVQKYIYYFSN